MQGLWFRVQGPKTITRVTRVITQHRVSSGYSSERKFLEFKDKARSSLRVLLRYSIRAPISRFVAVQRAP